MVLRLQACFEKSSVFPPSGRTYVQHMVDQKHKCLPPRLSLLFPLCTALQHKLGQRHNPTICHRSLAFGFTFFHCGDPNQARAHVHTVTYTVSHTHARTHTGRLLWTTRRHMKLTSVNNPSKWRVRWTASPANAVGSSDQMHQVFKHTSQQMEGTQQLADISGTHRATETRQNKHHFQTNNVQTIYTPYTNTYYISKKSLLFCFYYYYYYLKNVFTDLFRRL